MRCTIAVICLFAFTARSSADDVASGTLAVAPQAESPKSTPPNASTASETASATATEPATETEIDAAVDPAKLAAVIALGADFLAKDAVTWRTEHNCISCHHAGLVVWALREAKQHGHVVDEPLLEELTRWIAESGSATTSLPRPESDPRALNEASISYALALGAEAAPGDISQAGIKRFLKTVQSDQLDDGSWSTWPETRPPIFGNSDERATAAAALALGAAAPDDAAAQPAHDKAIAWLRANPTDDDPQSLALRVVLWQRLGLSPDEAAPWIARIRARQNADGGWSQTAEMASDVWATGQALYALAHAGAKSNDPAVRRGQAFLIATQREDGSWPMTSRPTKPGGEGSTSLIPITGGGSAWGVLGLVASQAPASRAAQ